jgi:hypothetical protein
VSFNPILCLVNTFDKVVGTRADLIENPGDILADDTEKYKVDG